MPKEKLNLNLGEKDGNAFFLIGYFQREAKKADWTDEEIAKVRDEAMSKDYNYLIQVLISV